MIRVFFVLCFSISWIIQASAEVSRPNVLFLAVDDMNDWIGCLAGTAPGEGLRAITPNLDKLAARGVNFTNAHTAGVFCAPSRAAIFSGQYASTTGCYDSANYFVNRPEIESLQTSFSKAGYTTLGTGKLYHHPVGAIDQRGWNEFYLRTREQRENGWALDSWNEGTPFPKPFPASVYNEGQEITGGLFLEWAGLPNEQEEDMADTIRVKWAVEQLQKKHEEPFFLACGIYAPHYPHYCPQKYFDLYDRDEIELPNYKGDDLDDLPPKIAKSYANRLKIRKKLEDLDALKDSIHGYLACISYADAMMGRVLDALEASPHVDNTIVVLWSDHGYHLGEKNWGKHTLWERTSNVPFLWAGPGVASGVKSDVTVSLIDMYPTFVEMCGLPKPYQALEGTSLARTLKNPAEASDRNVYLPHMRPGEFAIMNREWRYIRYGDDGEELYQVQKDPHEWNNLASDPKHAERMKEMRGYAPETFAEPEPRLNSRKDLVIEGESYRWEKDKGNYQPPPKYLPYTIPPVSNAAAKKGTGVQNDGNRGQEESNEGNSGKELPISREEAYSVLSPAKPREGKRARNPEGLAGRVVTGYQGWFRAKGDGSGMGFHHYKQRGKFEPGHCTIDLWPDLSEFDEEEKFPTAFRRSDGSVAHVFSSIHPRTVDRHFSWIAEYGIDGAFVQRFALHGAKKHRNSRSLKWENEKLKLVRDAAMKHGRSWILMYDLSGLKDEDFERLAEDWKHLRRRMQLGTDPNDSAYLHLDGKPLVAIWGVGFGDDRDYSLEKAAWFVRLLKYNPEWGGMSVMLGVPYGWREQNRDATRDPELHEVLKMADVLSPWSVGRYRDMEKEMADVVAHQIADRKWCEQEKIEYLPVLFPGFSWTNMKDDKLSFIPRKKGRFYWQQFVATAAAGNDSAYLAMFDEIDEGTAIFKCTDDPPVGKSVFQTYEGLPSDHYLWLSGEGGRLLRGELPSR